MINNNLLYKYFLRLCTILNPGGPWRSSGKKLRPKSSSGCKSLKAVHFNRISLLQGVIMSVRRVKVLRTTISRNDCIRIIRNTSRSVTRLLPCERTKTKRKSLRAVLLSQIRPKRNIIVAKSSCRRFAASIKRQLACEKRVSRSRSRESYSLPARS